MNMKNAIDKLGESEIRFLNISRREKKTISNDFSNPVIPSPV